MRAREPYWWNGVNKFWVGFVNIGGNSKLGAAGGSCSQSSSYIYASITLLVSGLSMLCVSTSVCLSVCVYLCVPVFTPGPGPAVYQDRRLSYLGMHYSPAYTMRCFCAPKPPFVTPGPPTYRYEDYPPYLEPRAPIYTMAARTRYPLVVHSNNTIHFNNY